MKKFLLTLFVAVLSATQLFAVDESCGNEPGTFDCAITVSAIAFNQVALSISAASSTPYFWTVILKSEYDAIAAGGSYGSLANLTNAYLSVYGSSVVDRGSVSYTLTSLQPSTEYVVYAIAVDLTNLQAVGEATIATFSTPAAQGGPCGDNLYWSYAGNTLTITGTGAMYDYDNTNNKAPWRTLTMNNVVLPEGMTSIGDFAFALCNGITSITIPSSVTSIGQEAFASCTGLASITIPESVSAIGWYAFYNCSGLVSIIVEAGNTVFDSRNNCNAIIETATNNLIVGCRNTTIPSSVTSIGNYAFANCTALTSIIIPNSVVSIGRYSFNNCTGLTSLNIPSSMQSMGESAFAGCSNLTAIACGAVTPPACGNSCFDGVTASIPVYVPCANYVEVYRVANAWSVFTNIQAIGGDCAPQKCGDDLYWEYADNTLTITGTGAMYDFTYQTIPWAQLPITTISLPDGLTHIGNEAFDDCIGVTSVDIPSSVTSIGEWAFFGTGLTSVTIPDAVTGIGLGAFQQCHNLTSVTLSNALTTIGNQAFSACYSLASIVIPESVTSIGRYAFYHCESLTTITIPESVEHVYTNAFEGCTGLTSVIWNAPNVPGSDCLLDNTIYPIFGIQDMAITSFVIGEGVVSLPVALCYNLPIQQITIPASVELIDSYAFANCSALTSITCEATVPPVCGEVCFDGVTKSIPVYVPCASVAAYQAAEGWSAFTNILPIEGSCEDIGTGLEPQSVTPAAAGKFLRGGHVMINRNDRVIDMLGRCL